MVPRPPGSIASRSDGKPRVLVVDDHPGMLKAVSSLLSGDYQVAGTATGGRQAIEMAHRVLPDAIVLDVSLPDLDGYQTIAALEAAGSRVPVVLLSMLETQEFVDRAFRSGGCGYVLKTRVATDLATAIDNVLRGRKFVPSLASLAGLGHGHALHLHGGEASLVDELAATFDRALRRGEATCVIAAEPVREGLASRLRGRGWNDGPSGLGRLLAIDAREALRNVMHGGLPDSQVLAAFIDRLEVFRRGAVDGGAPSLTIFGAGCALLHAEGNTQGAILMEGLWDSLARPLPFLMICGYPAAGVTDTRHDLWSRVCEAHGMLCHTHPA